MPDQNFRVMSTPEDFAANNLRYTTTTADMDAPPPAAWHRLDQAEQNVEALAGLVEKLTMRLGPVCSPFDEATGTTGGTTGGGDAVEAEGQLAARLRNHANRIDGIASEVERLLKRLEV